MYSRGLGTGLVVLILAIAGQGLAVVALGMVVKAIADIADINQRILARVESE